MRRAVAFSSLLLSALVATTAVAQAGKPSTTRTVGATFAFLLAALAVAAGSAQAGSPHFVGDPTATRAGDTLTVSGKIAGLGNEPQVSVRVSAEAACLNPGGNFPQAANKETFAVEGTFPVQNGKALFSLDLVAAFDPSCSPPMSVVWGDVLVQDLTSGISTTISGPF